MYKLAKKRVPKMFFEYADTGSWTSSTYKRNENDFKSISFRQRVAKNMSNRNLSKIIIGEDVNMPLVLSPIGICGLQYANGEILAAKAAEKKGIPFTLSTMSICSIEDVAENTSKPFWFQLYMMKDRTFMDKLIKRAQSAKCSALVVTLDLQVMGQRHNDIRNNLEAPPKINLNTIMQFLSRPSWCLNMMTAKKLNFGNIMGHVTNVTNLSSLASWTADQFDPTLTWEDIAWIKDRWKGKLILKGIMDSEDAMLAVKAGADAIIISNHGGRQLDGAPSTISVLPEIVDTVNSKVEVHFDGGVRSGQDVLKALALGADCIHIGRPYVYGLGAKGQEGVETAIEIIKKELDLTMAMCGETNISNVGLHNLHHNPFKIIN